MSIPRFFKSLFSTATPRLASSRRHAKKRSSCRPVLEALEVRLVPVVNAAASYPTTILPGTGFDGVVRVLAPNGNCTGTLLQTGRHILTAAHCVDGDVDTSTPPDGIGDQGNGMVDAGTHRVQFDLPGSAGMPRAITFNVPAANITVHRQWNGIFNQGSDIAIIDLGEAAPFDAEKRSIYRDREEVAEGQFFGFLGYGATNRVNTAVDSDCPGGVGTICSGNFGQSNNMPVQPTAFGTKRLGFNRVDRIVSLPAGSNNPFDEYLRFDLDNPASRTDPGVPREALSAQGDSGGPLFISGAIAGVSSGATTVTIFGGTAAYTRVSSFADWIDRTVGGRYDLVIDMANQVPGNDRLPDAITVIKATIPIFGERLFISVNGRAAYDDFFASVRSITIRGSNDDDVLTVPSDLGMAVAFNGRGGSDLFLVENSAKAHTIDVDSTGFGVRGPGGTVGSHTGIERLSVIGDSRDTVNVYSTSSSTPVSVTDAGTVLVAPAGLLRLLSGQVSVNGDGATKLTINDVSNTSSEAKYVVDAYQLAASPQPTFDVAIDYSQLSSLTINGGRGGSFFQVRNTPQAPVVLNTGTGADTVLVQGTTGQVTINGQAGLDTVNIGLNGSVRSIRNGLTVTNDGAYSAVNVDNSADTVARTGILYRNGAYTGIIGLTPGADIVLRSRDLRSLTIRAGTPLDGNGNIFRIHDTPTSNTPGGLTTTVSTGDGPDSVLVTGTRGALALNAQGGFNTITVGSLTVGQDTIGGAISISGAGGTTIVTIDDQPSRAGRILTHTITAAAYTRTGAATVNLSNVHSFILRAGSAQDTINVQGNPTQQFFSGFDILAGPGNDIFNVGNASNQLTGIGSITTLDGEAGSDALNLYDQGSTASKTYTIGLSFGFYPFVNSPDARISHFNNESILLTGGPLDDLFLVDGTAAGTSTTLNGGDGNDGFIVGDGPGLGGIAGRLRFDGQTGGGGGGFARVNDSVGTAARTYTWDGNALRWGGVTVEAANLGLFQLISGRGDDAYRVSALGPIPLALGDAGGVDRLTGPDTATRWNLTGTDFGDLGPAALFAAIENLVGGSAADTFVFADYAGLSGSINGGGGVNTLDYSGSNGDNTLSLPGLVSRYRGGGNAADSAGGNHGTILGDVTFVPGRVGLAFDFDGNLDYVDLGSDASLDLPGSMSVSLWVRLDTLNHYKYFLADFDSPGGNVSQGALGAGLFASVFGWFQAYTDGTGDTLEGTTPIQLNQWFHLSVVRDDAAKIVRLYVNGVLDSSLSYAGKTVVPLQGSKILGGSLPNFPADFIDGRLDEVGIYNRALSLAEIQALASATNGVVVNLPLGTASGLTGGIARIQDVIGSSGDDILVGNGGNVLSGGAGRDLLIAGALASILNGGSDDDILIGGTTDYDRNAAALKAIMAEWTTSGTASLLDATTAHSNGKRNRLTGGAGADVFFARLGSELLDFNPATDDLITIT